MEPCQDPYHILLSHENKTAANSYDLPKNTTSPLKLVFDFFKNFIYTSVPFWWVFFSCVPSRSGMTRAWEFHALTCDVAEHLERPQGPAAVGVDVEEARGVASVPVHLAGLLIEGWKDTKAAERRRCLALRVPLEDQ